MNWKLFITACISACIISFPQNIIGCGPDADPYDYYTSFFHPYLPDAPDYKPFYYTGYNFLYDDNEPQDVSELLTDEWVNYCKGKVSKKDASVFMNKFSVKDIDALYKKVDKNIVKKLADSVSNNSMTKYLLDTKDKEALGYILHAKQVEPYVVGSADYWEAPKRDSIKMDRLIKNGKILYKATQSNFIKLRIGYQIMRLMHYSNRFSEAISAYDDFVAPNTTPSVLQPLSLALKAGAQFKSGHPEEAAYNFSKAFAASGAKRVSNYLGFIWSITSTRDRNDYLQYCKNDKERADMLSLFAMSSIGNELPAMEEIVKLHPASPSLEVLVVREINKLEEKYFTPLLRNEEGGRSIYASWLYDGTDTMIAGGKEKTIALADFLNGAADKNVANKALFATGSAYCYYMAKKYNEAESALKKAKTLHPSEKIKDQIELTNILITLSEQKNIDEKFEAQLLPSLQWLLNKTKQPGNSIGYWDINYWRNFYRNLLNDIVARKYYQQGNIAKQILAAGSADKINNSYYYESTAMDLMRNIETMHAIALFDIYNNKQPSPFEKFLIKNNSIQKNDVVDYIGTSYIRDYEFDKAIPWLQRSPDKGLTKIDKNPFIELLYDREAQLRSERKFSTTKLNFAMQMAALKNLISTNKAGAKDLYKYATALYNITYYGHTWEIVAYFRSSSTGYYIPDKASNFEKEYYGCNSAHDFFEKAMNKATDKNFKAKCLFMMAKCSQKQLDRPKYEDYYNKEYSSFDSAEQKYFDRFMNNIYFPKLVKDYSSTSFYKEAYNSCSYLRDFVKRMK